MNEALSYVDNSTIIDQESGIIKQYLDNIIATYKESINFSTLNRATIEESLEQYYQCYGVSQAFLIILNVLFDKFKIGELEKFKQLSPGIGNWLTNITALGVDPSAEGIIYKSSFQYLDENMVMKLSKDPSNIELIHEYYIGLQLNELRQQIPNFMFVYGLFKCGLSEPICSEKGGSNFMLAERVKGNTMLDMIINPGKFTMKMAFTAIAQVCMALQMAFDAYGFVHQDLHMKNIMIRKRRENETIEYLIGGEKIYLVSDFFATIIDYGFSVIRGPEGKYFKVKKFERDWMNQELKPGIDLFKMMSYFIATLENNPTNGPIINIINQAFANVGVPAIARNNHYYPVEYNENLVNLQPYVFLSSLLKLLPEEITPDIYINKPPEGYVIANMSACKTVDATIKSMDTLPVIGESCRGDPWKKLSGHWQDKYGNPRYWFECGKYYFDGSFNVITFPKGMDLYHGSRSLAYYNISYPLGFEYFNTDNNWITNKGLQYLKSNASDKSKEELIKTQAPIALGYYGDQEVARTYSNQYPSKNPEQNCGGNCTFAFKLIKNATFVDLYDPFNIMVLFTRDPALSPKGKEILQVAYRITGESNFMDLQRQFGPGFINLPEGMYSQLQQAFNPFRRFLMDSRRGTLRNPRNQANEDYFVPKELMNSFLPRGYAGFCNPRTPYVEGEGKGNYRFAELVFGKDVLEYVERNFSNPFDWQYFNNKRLFGQIGKLIQDMKKYKTFNINFHQGDLYQHSVWVALFVQKQFVKQTQWVAGIPEEFKDLCVISGFLHDIGKGGDLVFMFYDKPNHPEVGFEYLMGSQIYRFAKDAGTLNVSELMKNINVSKRYSGVMAFLVLAHWEFGDHIRQMTGNNTDIIALKYATKLKEMWTRAGITVSSVEEAKLLAAMAMLISACDIMGSEAYMNPERFDALALELTKDPHKAVNDLNAKLDSFPYITNRPKVHRGASNYKRFQIKEKGLILRQATLGALNKIQN